MGQRGGCFGLLDEGPIEGATNEDEHKLFLFLFFSAQNNTGPNMPLQPKSVFSQKGPTKVNNFLFTLFFFFFFQSLLSFGHSKQTN